MTNTLYFYEIPVTDIGRACDFYSLLLGEEISWTQSVDNLVALLPGRGGPAGTLIQGPDYRPNKGGAGVIVYLTVAPDLLADLAAVEEGGGQVLMERTPIGPNGFVAYILDSEGNKIGLHAHG